MKKTCRRIAHQKNQMSFGQSIMKKEKHVSGRAMTRMAWFIDEVPPEDLPEAEEELRQLGLNASAVGNRLQQRALSAIGARILREHSNAARSRTSLQGIIDLSNKLN